MSTGPKALRDVGSAIGVLPRDFAGFRSTRAFAGLQSAADIGTLAVRVARSAATPPFTWLPLALVEASTVFRRCLFAMVISVGIWTLGFGTILFGAFVVNIGVADRFPGGTHLGYLREVNTWITMMVFAGAAGSSAAADLGARRIREELDALDVLGVDRIRTLVLPRVVGFTFAGVVLPLLALLTTTFLNWLLSPAILHYTKGVYMEGLQRNVFGIDLYASMLKHTLMAAFVAIVACQKGLSCERGAEGVGKAVNQTVVLSFLGIWFINTFFNLAYLSFVPNASALRG